MPLLATPFSLYSWSVGTVPVRTLAKGESVSLGSTWNIITPPRAPSAGTSSYHHLLCFIAKPFHTNAPLPCPTRQPWLFNRGGYDRQGSPTLAGVIVF